MIREGQTRFTCEQCETTGPIRAWWATDTGTICGWCYESQRDLIEHWAADWEDKLPPDPNAEYDGERLPWSLRGTQADKPVSFLARLRRLVRPLS